MNLENNNDINEEMFTDTDGSTSGGAVNAPEKKYTDDDVNRIVGKKKELTRKQMEQEFASRNKETDELLAILKAGTGKETVGDLKEAFAEYYKNNGVNVDTPKAQSYSKRDLDTLARADADEIISLGDNEVAEEIDRLTNLGNDNLSEREKTTLELLSKHKVHADKMKELKEIGISEEVYNGTDFQEFAAMFDSKTPLSKVYEIFASTKNQKNVKPMGSVKTTSAPTAVKDYYTPEEAKRLTTADFNSTPGLLEAVEKSMLKWKK